jgi:hypothetical protein
MEFHELQQIVESNARAIQAMLDAQATERLKHEEFVERMDNTIVRLEASAVRQDALIERLTTVNEGVVRLVSFLDDDRPTILRKLNSIEDKVDQLLQERQIDGGSF